MGIPDVSDVLRFETEQRGTISVGCDPIRADDDAPCCLSAVVDIAKTAAGRAMPHQAAVCIEHNEIDLDDAVEILTFF